MNAVDLWEIGRAVYSIGLLLIGTITVPLAVLFLRMLPQALEACRQLATAITLHANMVKRDANNDARLAEMAADVKTIKADVDTIKRAA